MSLALFQSFKSNNIIRGEIPVENAFGLHGRALGDRAFGGFLAVQGQGEIQPVSVKLKVHVVKGRGDYTPFGVEFAKQSAKLCVKLARVILSHRPAALVVLGLSPSVKHTSFAKAVDEFVKQHVSRMLRAVRYFSGHPVPSQVRSWFFYRQQKNTICDRSASVKFRFPNSRSKRNEIFESRHPQLSGGWA
jgi:hypothetical protein